jgi:hypothetical protein
MYWKRGREDNMPVTIDDMMEAAAAGVLRALDARRAGGARSEDVASAAPEGLVRSGFGVNIVITCGGLRDPNIPGASFFPPQTQT